MADVKSCVCFIIILTSYFVCGKNVICYYGSWATYRPAVGKFEVSNINTDLCTHVMYSFAGLQNGRMTSLDPWLDLPDNWGRDNFGEFTALKKKNPNLKTILAVGGWNEGSAKYSVMASTAANRLAFINSAVSMVLAHGFDGIDLDWEYPNRRDSTFGPADVTNFSLLVKELRTICDEYGWFLSSAVSSVAAAAALSYDIPEISKNLDMINIMAYDMYGAWDPVTGHNAPLHRGVGDVGASSELNTVEAALDYWISQGAPVEKIALGVPFYGRTFTLSSPSLTSPRASASGAGISGPYTQTTGFIGYNEFCLELSQETWTREYDSLAKVPYAYSGRNWVSYDDTSSITSKVEYAKSLGINNIMIWSIETDDFHGLCGDGDWPLLRAINNALDSSTNPTTELTSTASTSDITTEAMTTSTPSTPEITTEATTSIASSTEVTTEATTTSIASTAEITNEPTTNEASTTELQPETTSSIITTTVCPTSAPIVTSTVITPPPICTEQGAVSNPFDCGSFFVCVRTALGGLEPIQLTCPASLHYDEVLKVCNYPQFANCTVSV